MWVRDYAYETPVFFIDDVINSLVAEKRIKIGQILRQIVADSEKRLGLKYLLAEALRSELVRDVIAQVSIPLVPFLLKVYIRKYSALTADAHVKKERVAYLLATLDGLPSVDSSLSRIIRVSKSIEKLMAGLSESKGMLAETENNVSLHNLLNDEGAMLKELLARQAQASSSNKYLAYLFFVESKTISDEVKSSYLEKAVSILKNELAWLEAVELYEWLVQKRIGCLLAPAALMDLAWIHFQLGQYEKALGLYEQCKERISNGDIELQGEVLRKRIRCMERMGGESLHQAIKIGEQEKTNGKWNNRTKARLMRTIGWCYIIAGKHTKAIEITGDAIEVFAKVDGKLRKYDLARCYNNLGAAYELANNLEKSTEYHVKCLKLMKRLHSLKWMSGSYLNLSIVYRKREKYAKSLSYAKKAERIKRNILDRDELPVVLFNKSFTLICRALRENRSDGAEITANLKEARELREEHGSNKQVMAILALATIANVALDCEGLQELKDEFIGKVKKDGLAFVEDDKLPLIHKALGLLESDMYVRSEADKEEEILFDI